MTEETIDYFKYRALLAELEPLKGKKKPVQDFIKKLYELSNSFNSYAKDYSNQPETLRYAFMLATRAMEYDRSAKPIRESIRRNIRSAANKLTDLDTVTSENALETYEFWTETIDFSPNSLEQLHKQFPIMEILGKDRIYFATWSLKEFKPFSDYDKACSMYLFNKFGENVVSTKYPVSAKEKDKVIQKAKHLFEVSQIILKESHEHNCSSSEEHY